MKSILTLGALGAAAFPAIAFSYLPSPVSTPVAVAQMYRSEAAYIWPARGTITQGFLPNISHMGIDIAGPVGTPVVAAADGRVVYAGWDDFGLGNAIKIEHENGNFTIYGHNQRLLVEAGQAVSQGQAIAYMGSTGFSNGPHLHFEVRRGNDNWLDPIAYLPPLVVGKIPPRTQIETFFTFRFP